MLVERKIMDVNHTKPKKFVWVHDKAGNKFICPAEALKDPKYASEEELKNCVDDALVGGDKGGHSW
jgi:hypothetical protein